MKMKLILLGLSCLLILFSCQKEERIIKEIISPDSIKQEQLVQIKQLIPENVQIVPDRIPIGNSPILNTDEIIRLVDCGEQQCYHILPSLIHQLQRTADKNCRAMILSICCCTNDRQWCFRFRIPPRIRCVNLGVSKQLLPELPPLTKDD